MYTQVIGKLRLALSPPEPAWANVPLYVSARGLTTSPIPVGLGTIDAEFDLIDHALVIRSGDGRSERRPLGGAVAEFYHDVMDALRRLDVDVAISVLPQEVPDPIPFPDDRVHNVYDASQVERFQHVLSMIDVVLKEHRAPFRGRTTPVHFFWGTFDLAVTRFSGRRVDPPPGAGLIARVAGDTEQICAGWWPGDDHVRYPAFFSYAYPAPAGIEGASIQPGSAQWSASAREFLLPYETARLAADPRATIRDFLISTYTSAAKLLGWDPSLTQVDLGSSRQGPTDSAYHPPTAH
jgi:hypothetical protein